MAPGPRHAGRNLSSPRDEKPLADLPEADRQAWQQLWDDVAALLKR
jgi:hypothetical protein